MGPIMPRHVLVEEKEQCCVCSAFADASAMGSAEVFFAGFVVGTTAVAEGDRANVPFCIVHTTMLAITMRAHVGTGVKRRA